MTQQAAPGLASILQIAMPVKDINRAVAFYRDTLGMKFLFQAGNLAFFDCDGVRLMLDIAEDKEFDHPGSVLYFRVPDVNASYEALRGRGVEFISEPHIVHKDDKQELWMAFFRDGEQSVHALAAEVPI
jgi:catechol 2,3-dioxygenase-like lactoylglutathione lyase family enzyme